MEKMIENKQIKKEEGWIGRKIKNEDGRIQGVVK